MHRAGHALWFVFVAACGLDAGGLAPDAPDAAPADTPLPHLPEAGSTPVVDAALDADADADAASDAAVDASLDAAVDAAPVDAGTDAASKDAGFPGPFDCNGGTVSDCASSCAGKPTACVFCKNGTGARKGFCRAVTAGCTTNPPASYGVCP